MSAIPQVTSISDRLTTPLRQVAQRQWYVLAVIGIFKTLIVALVALLAAAMLLGFFQSIWVPVRIAVAAMTWIVVIGSAVRFLRPALRRWSLSRAAMQIEHQHPAIQERLSSAVELSSETDLAFRGSPALIAHLIRQAESDAANVKPDRVVPTDRAIRWALLFVPVLVAWLIIALMQGTSKTAMRGLYHIIMPWRPLPTLLIQVHVTPGDVTLVQGDPLDVTARVTFANGTGHNVGHASLIRQYENGQRITDDMDAAGPRDYRSHFDDLQQSFKYMVSTDQGDSQWFQTTVHPRPQINSIDVRCDYPAYTGLSATIASGKDGSIEALVGTRVTLTIHTEQEVDLSKSQIVIDEGQPEELRVPMTQVAPGKPDYQTQLIVNHSGEYKINLTNNFDLKNKDEQPRSIVAQPDEAPTIVIRLPDAQITVRPDDVIPVKYLANDDFGITKIEAMLQIDDRPVQTVPVAFKTTDKRTVTGPDYVLSVADVLKTANVDSADHISYQLKVTDNRDPDPQFSFSDKQTLRINKNESQSFQAKEERKIADDLRRAIEKGIDNLNHADQQVSPAKDADARQQLQRWNLDQLHLATQLLPRTSQDLNKAADEAANTVFQDVAREVKRIANQPIRAAAESTAQADLNVDNGQERRDAASQSIEKIVEARTALQKLLQEDRINKDLRAAEAARDLEEAARKQQQAADEMKPQQQVDQSKDPQARQQQQDAMRKQEQANQKLRQAIDQAEALRDPKAQETAQELQNLIRKVEDTEKQQDQNADQTQKQEQAENIAQKANELAKKQEALNKEIEKSAEQNKDALQKADARAPNKDQQNEIVKNLDRNNLQAAHDQMKQAANQLHQEAQQLQNQAKSNDLHPDQKEQDALNEDQQAQQNAQNEQNQAQQAANQLNQEAQQAATPKSDDSAIQNAKQQAKAIEQAAADMHPKAAEAQADAHAAEKDAQKAEQAADAAAQAADAQAAQKDLNDAAKDLNKAAQELADAAKQNADADKAQMTKAQQKEAQAAGEEAQAQAAEQDALAKALEGEQHDLAAAQQNAQNTDQIAQQQNQIANQTREAEQQAQRLQQQAQQAQNPNVAHRAEQAKAELAKAEHHAAEAAHDEQQAAQDQQQAANAPNAEQAQTAEQAADKALEQAAQQQQQAQDALAKAEAELRNLPADAEANAEQGQPDADHQGNEQGQHEAAEQAAQGAQEAAQAQQEANQRNPEAAQQAANALHQAAQQMARAVPGLKEEQGHEPGNDPGDEASDEPAHDPSQTIDSKQGMAASPAPVEIPASVRDIGISADQWAKLPELAKKDLMNAAQQSGPPSYRQMIKDYYVRVAKIAGRGSAVQ